MSHALESFKALLKLAERQEATLIEMLVAAHGPFSVDPTSIEIINARAAIRELEDEAAKPMPFIFGGSDTISGS